MNHMELVQLGANYATIAQGVTGIVALVVSIVALVMAGNAGSLKKITAVK